MWASYDPRAICSPLGFLIRSYKSWIGTIFFFNQELLGINIKKKKQFPFPVYATDPSRSGNGPNYGPGATSRPSIVSCSAPLCLISSLVVSPSRPDKQSMSYAAPSSFSIQVKGGSGWRPPGASTPPSPSHRMTTTTASKMRCKSTGSGAVLPSEFFRQLSSSPCSRFSPAGRGRASRRDGRHRLHLDQPQRPAAAAGEQPGPGGERSW